MAKRRSREIGWGMTDILIWEQTQEIIRLQDVVAAGITFPTTTTTSTSTSTTTSTTSTTTTSPSDIRLKYNIIFTGNMRGKVKEYTWEWNNIAHTLNLDSYPTKGILAQEALEIYPHAISIGEDGYLRVDYSKIPKE